MWRTRVIADLRNIKPTASSAIGSWVVWRFHVDVDASVPVKIRATNPSDRATSPHVALQTSSFTYKSIKKTDTKFRFGR